MKNAKRMLDDIEAPIPEGAELLVKEFLKYDGTEIWNIIIATIKRASKKQTLSFIKEIEVTIANQPKALEDWKKQKALFEKEFNEPFGKLLSGA